MLHHRHIRLTVPLKRSFCLYQLRRLTEWFGINGVVLQRVQYYLTGRSQLLLLWSEESPFMLMTHKSTHKYTTVVHCSTKLYAGNSAWIAVAQTAKQISTKSNTNKVQITNKNIILFNLTANYLVQQQFI